MPVDASVFNNIHSFQDYNMANQDFLSRQQAAQLDAATKGNVLKGQALYAAAQTGDPTTWQNTLQKLNANGIDTSDVPADVGAGAKYAEGLRLAQSPLGSLLGAASKLDANANTAQTAAGQVPAGGGNAIATMLLSGGGLNPSAGVPKPQSQPPLSINDAKTLPPSAVTSPRITATSPSLNGFAPNMASDINGVAADMNGGVPVQTAPPVAPQPVNSAPQFVPPQSDPNKTLAANQADYQHALDAFNANNKAAIAGSVTTAEENAKKNVLQETGALGSKDILRLYKKMGDEAPKVPGGIISNLGADISNAANAPTDGAINRGAYEADLNNLYLATIRSLAGTGRVQKAELDKIAQAAPKPTDATAVKISKANAHLEDYNQRMVDMGFSPATGQRLAAGEQPQLVPQIPTPGKQSSIPTISSPSDPEFEKLPSGAQFTGPDGVVRIKH